MNAPSILAHEGGSEGFIFVQYPYRHDVGKSG